MKRDPRSIWNKSRKDAKPVTSGQVARLIAIVTEEIYDEIDRVDRDIRNEMPDDNSALENDIRYLEQRVTNIEDDIRR